jgi:cellulose synthase/poly-beta-1,6-N-acetylglucosamine synthase-like glycosyltransferase
VTARRYPSHEAGSPHAAPGFVAAPDGSPWAVVALAGIAVALTGAFGFTGLVLAVGLAIQVVFIVFFARHLAFAAAAMRSAPADLHAPPVDTGFRPTVSVLVACKNEELVAERLVASLVALDYPSNRLELVVVDDSSSDGTGELLDRLAVGEPRLRCLHRPPGAGGGKSGALNAALEAATGEVIVVFDADHRPRPDVVRRLVRHLEDPTIAAVQGRCEIANADDSPLTKLIAIDYFAGYLVNEYGRQSLCQLPAYGGANCAVRASTLRAAGGWNVGSVTEDTDLTMRLLLGGERVRYDVSAVDAEEAVATIGAFWRQRYRWARGHQQVWRDYRRAVLRSPFLSWAEKVETTMFLFVFHLPVLSTVGMAILGLWLTGVVQPLDPLELFLLWTLLFLGPLSELGTGLLVLRSKRGDALALVFFLPLFLLSIALCTKAWLDGVLGREYAWAKTARAGDLGPQGAAA